MDDNDRAAAVKRIKETFIAVAIGLVMHFLIENWVPVNLVLGFFINYFYIFYLFFLLPLALSALIVFFISYAADRLKGNYGRETFLLVVALTAFAFSVYMIIFILGHPVPLICTPLFTIFRLIRRIFLR